MGIANRQDRTYFASGVSFVSWRVEHRRSFTWHRSGSPSIRLSNRNRGRQPLVTSRILRLVGKFSGFLSAYPNWLPPTQTIQTQPSSSSRVWTHTHARGVGWHAGTSSVSEAVHLPITPKSRLAQNFFFTRGFGVK